MFSFLIHGVHLIDSCLAMLTKREIACVFFTKPYKHCETQDRNFRSAVGYHNILKSCAGGGIERTFLSITRALAVDIGHVVGVQLLFLCCLF